MLRRLALGSLALLLLLALALGLLLARNSRTPSPTDFSASALLQTPPPPLSQETTLKVVTFNVHDLRVVSDHRPERMKAIAAALAKLDPDIVGFQEAFIEADRAILLQGLEATRLKYHQYFPSGSVGSGLLVSSAYPIAEHYFFRYTQGGVWYRVWHGDWWAGKGIALARIALPAGGYLDFYNTHAHASYGVKEYESIRLSNMQEVLPFIDQTATKSSPIIIAGDFNCRVGTEQYAALRVDEILQRALDGDTGVDHLFAYKSKGYTFELLKSDVIEEMFPVEGGESELSDHAGHMATIRITPTS